MTMSAMKIDSPTRGISVEPTVLVMGMGLTGASCARFFAGRGIVAEFIDTRPEPPGMNAILDAMPDARIQVGEQCSAVRPTIEQIVISPGFDLDASVLGEARGRGLDIVSDIDLFVGECTAPIIAITGSNGKSTVTSMLDEALSAAGLSTAVGANLGTPALDLLDHDTDVFVLELSSFQLERSRAVPATAAVILNLSPDHLDQHGDMSAYRMAKARIYSDCKHAVVNRDEPDLASLVMQGTPVTTFGLDQPMTGQLGIRQTARGECIACGEDLLISVDELPLIGRHNLSNSLAALALGAALGANLNSMAQALKRFSGLPHRMQVVSTAAGAKWINDSKATNVAAAVTSLASIEDPVVLIAGGDAKGVTFAALATELEGRSCTAILFGQDARRMARELAGSCELQVVTDIREAVDKALHIVVPGTTVLLAPACSSLDMFSNFAERGDLFTAAVRELAQ
ncbi:MAG: UDP-N-acetylmuramoyl-L-alanine--D-glutamate ligase [Chromatiales bacterium]|nr:UDP-N-acetylmuramoyl-L-alanine--D-glutamate ligase [Chromatiales bacterium]